jgi:hypothetical protein
LTREQDGDAEEKRAAKNQELNVSLKLGGLCAKVRLSAFRRNTRWA